MIIHLRITENGCRVWQKHLVECLKILPDADVRLKRTHSQTTVSSAMKTLVLAERTMLRHGQASHADICHPDALDIPLATSEIPDFTIDLTGQHTDISGEGRILQPRFNDAIDEEALAAILIGDGTPKITIHDLSSRCLVASGVASLEAAVGITGGMEAVYSRVTMLIVNIVKGMKEETSKQSFNQSPSLRAVDTGKHLAKMFAANTARYLYHLCCHSGHWRVGWRRTEDGGVWQNFSLKGPGWAILPHPVDHFYADPFPIHWKGRDYIFVEELDHKVGKGVISVIPMDDNGPMGPAQVVLEEPWHLSYPFLIEWNDDIWMIPESSLNNDVAIYRAVDFPHKWERHQTLLDGVEAADATVVNYQGQWWMFAVTRAGVGGYSDTLSLYHAADLMGPWSPHPENFMLIDHETARPAGNMIFKNDKLWRPVQNCANGYGAALGLAEVTRLDEEHFEQHVETVLHPGGSAWPGRKLHTLNKCGTLEVIDGSIIRPKFRPFANWVDRRFIPQ